jgi:carbon-monoxide dehydrogenase small subunit
LSDIVEIGVTINGRHDRYRVRVRQHLADFLREELELTGTHLGCEHGVCGACTVRIDGATVRGCLVLAVQVDGKNVETVEGLSDDGTLGALQQAFIDGNAAQCGFCTPGMLLSAQELIDRGEIMSREEIRDHMSGNFCRCTGYQSIVDAVESVMKRSASETGKA